MNWLLILCANPLDPVVTLVGAHGRSEIWLLKYCYLLLRFYSVIYCESKECNHSWIEEVNGISILANQMPEQSD